MKRMKAENEYELENTRQRKPWLNLIDVNERKSQDIQREIRDLQNNIDLGEQEVNEKKELLTTLKKQLIDLRKKQDEYDASQSSGSWNLFGGVVNPSSQIDQIIRDKNNLEAQIKRQEEEVERNRQHEEAVLPEDLDYKEVRGLSSEVIEKLSKHRPVNLGQASRIQGITPAAISLLRIYLKKHSLFFKQSA